MPRRAISSHDLRQLLILVTLRSAHHLTKHGVQSPVKSCEQQPKKYWVNIHVLFAMWFTDTVFKSIKRVDFYLTTASTHCHYDCLPIQSQNTSNIHFRHWQHTSTHHHLSVAWDTLGNQICILMSFSLLFFAYPGMFVQLEFNKTVNFRLTPNVLTCSDLISVSRWWNSTNSYKIPKKKRIKLWGKYHICLEE